MFNFIYEKFEEKFDEKFNEKLNYFFYMLINNK